MWIEAWTLGHDLVGSHWSSSLAQILPVGAIFNNNSQVSVYRPEPSAWLLRPKILTNHDKVSKRGEADEEPEGVLAIKTT